MNSDLYVIIHQGDQTWHLDVTTDLSTIPQKVFNDACKMIARHQSAAVTKSSVVLLKELADVKKCKIEYEISNHRGVVKATLPDGEVKILLNEIRGETENVGELKLRIATLALPILKDL